MSQEKKTGHTGKISVQLDLRIGMSLAVTEVGKILAILRTAAILHTGHVVNNGVDREKRKLSGDYKLGKILFANKAGGNNLEISGF
eukprot:5933254-Heterocapsa_arctica.AAC.1